MPFFVPFDRDTFLPSPPPPLPLPSSLALRRRAAEDVAAPAERRLLRRDADGEPSTPFIGGVEVELRRVDADLSVGVSPADFGREDELSVLERDREELCVRPVGLELFFTSVVPLSRVGDGDRGRFGSFVDFRLLLELFALFVLARFLFGGLRNSWREAWRLRPFDEEDEEAAACSVFRIDDEGSGFG